ncbi:recombinase family protein [Roseomonas sp. CAU 1739]|uniref:recombinase family protein n=1 Tax=Roseomonas sp. CAU 1739 TaxID=3140364 RepID=UPI00325BEC8D
MLTESLDRLSRDQEHIAGFFKQARFAAVRIVTLAEGEISELHVGLKGTMGALYLKDLADKTRRGLEGRVREGRSGGGLCYGYRVVRGPIGQNGEPERGLREADPAQASVVQRIFQEFAGGHSPIAIARRLNEEQVSRPRGGFWSEGAIRGHARVGTGLLRNRLFIGELVWNRRRWIKDPSTGRRVARQNGEADVVVEAVPELRIIEQDLWERTQARLAAVARPECSPLAGSSGRTGPRWQDRRPRHVLTAKISCGTCGASFVAIGRDYLACQTAERRGPCGNRARVRRSRLEAQVLEALGSELMHPDHVAAFVSEFTAEWNRLVAAATAGLTTRRAELDRVRSQLERLVDALAEGTPIASVRSRMEALETRRAVLEAEVAAAGSGPAFPRLHGNLAEVYRTKVARLREALSAEGGPEIVEAIRELIDRVEVHPPAEGATVPRIELIGHLAAMLRAAGYAGAEVRPGARNAKSPPAGADGLDMFLSSELVDAGTGFEPVTFRL